MWTSNALRASAGIGRPYRAGLNVHCHMTSGIYSHAATCDSLFSRASLVSHPTSFEDDVDGQCTVQEVGRAPNISGSTVSVEPW